MDKLKDSGERREFESGAVRDIQVGKGRCDLMPLSAVGLVFKAEQNELACQIFQAIDNYVYTGNLQDLAAAVALFTGIKNNVDGDAFNSALTINTADLFLEVSKHYEQGCEKYGERNWEKGIPAHSYIDSGVRHLLKYIKGEDDEPHDRAFVWNMLGLIHTHIYNFEMLDLPCKEKIEKQIAAQKAAQEAAQAQHAAQEAAQKAEEAKAAAEFAMQEADIVPVEG